MKKPKITAAMRAAKANRELKAHLKKTRGESEWAKQQQWNLSHAEITANRAAHAKKLEAEENDEN